MPKPEEHIINDLTLSESLGILSQIKKEDFVIDNKDEFIKYIEKMVKDKYGISIQYDENGKITIVDTDGVVHKILEKENREEFLKNKFNSKIETLINKSMYDEAISEMENEEQYELNKDSIIFYKAEIYEKTMQFKNAIEQYSYCITNRIRVDKSIELNAINSDSYFKRAVAYYKINKFDKFNDEVKKQLNYSQITNIIKKFIKKFYKEIY